MNGNNIGCRIKNLLEKDNLSQGEFAKKMGMTEATISRYITGKRAPKGETVAKMAEILKTTSDYILTGNENKMETIPYTPTNKIPILGSVRAGVGGYVCEELIGYEEAHMPNCSSDTHFYLKVKGNSMEPRILEGDLALVKKQNDVESGDLAIVLVNGDEGVIKKVIKKESSIELHSFNPYYPPRIFSEEEMNKVKIIGKVVKIVMNTF